MKVLVDTSIWSLLLRRPRPEAEPLGAALARLVRARRVAMIGPIRQELLSGIKTTATFDRLCRDLRGFPDLVLETLDYEDAATAFNQCRAEGLQGSSTDFLICAVALRRDLPIFSADEDFRRFARVLPLRLYEPGS